jgi:phosphoribosylformimino-5-aminoimidazole carboxamide ribotide isomerase
MLILPAIDIRDGKCVRLRQGDYSQETVFGADPAAMARRWVEAGAAFLHLVDLDGARMGRPVNGVAIRNILAASSVPCQLGGGLRSDEHVAEVFGWGVERVVIGTRALKDPAWFQQLCRRWPGKIVLGLDARDGRVASEGWLETSDCSAFELARRCSMAQPAAIVYTDIGRDGMLAGPNFTALAEMVRAVDVPVIASGGVTTLEDVRQLSELGVAGCILGRTLYEGRLDLAEAIRLASSSVGGIGKPSA